jgi:hypothetical protein
VFINLSPLRTARVLGGLAALLVVIHVGVYFFVQWSGYGGLFGLVRTFQLDEENNVATWFSSGLHLAAAVLLLFIGRAERGRGGRHWRYWMGLSPVFLFTSLDETASLHEIAVVPFQRLLNAEEFLFFTWVVPAAALVAVLGIVYLRWFIGLPGRTRLIAGLSAGTFLLGALGFETIGGSLYSQKTELPYFFVSTAEEALEMAGLILWIYALMDFMSRTGTTMQVRFAPTARANSTAAGASDFDFPSKANRS